MAQEYANLAQLVARIPRGEQELIELTDREGTGEIDAARVEVALATAHSTANSYLAQAVELPLPAVPDLLTTHVCNLARYELYGDQPTEEVRRRRDDAIAWFRDLVAGRANLGLPPETPAQPIGTARRGKVASGYCWDAYP